MITDPRTSVRFVPRDQLLVADEPKRTVYLLKPPTVWDRGELERAIAAKGGMRANDIDMLSALRDGIARAYGDAESRERAPLLGQVDDAIERVKALGKKLLSGAFEVEDGARRYVEEHQEYLEHVAALSEVADLIAEAYPRYARLRAAAASYPLIRGACAARKFLVGWVNPPNGLGAADFSRDANGVREDLLLMLPDHHLIAIGDEVERLLHPTETERKNSASPSPGAETPAPSTAANATTSTTP